jgi:IS30 family transposase
MASRYRLVLTPARRGRHDSVIAVLIAPMHQLRAVLRKSVTCNRGIETTRHLVFTAHSKMPVLFSFNDRQTVRTPLQRTLLSRSSVEHHGRTLLLGGIHS